VTGPRFFGAPASIMLPLAALVSPHRAWRGLRFAPSPTKLRLYTVPGRALHREPLGARPLALPPLRCTGLGVLRPYYPRRAGHTTDRTAYNVPPTCSSHRLLS
jgi:hypothetical protein